MKKIIKECTVWFLCANLALLVTLSLSCCKSSEESTQGEKTGGAAVVEDASGYPANMVEALARGKKENKLVCIELYDNDCNYCMMMNGSLADQQVLDALSGLVHARITLEAEKVIDEFGLMESPSFLFFKPDGEIMEPFLQGFRSPHIFAAEINNFKLRLAGKEELAVPEDPHPDYGKG
ncbi:MAG: hypothetical protein KJ645_12210 [Planctomycetes bacterium]|nr:hypothetical protein [Planctomycetota bacterium]